MGTRRLGRELAVQALYRMAVTGEPEAVPVFWEQFGREGDDVRDFATRLVTGVCAERERIDALITTAAENWRVERIAVVDRCVLSVGAYELLADPQTPVSVVIDEAVEIARRFGEDGSAAFVNGVLDRVARLARSPLDEVEDRARR
jgi:N utilization substance protein B